MSDFKPLYRNTYHEAHRTGELKEWYASFEENKRCRDFIDELVNEHYDGLYLKGDIPEKTVAEFGFDRTRWVLANHIQLHSHDERYSPQIKAWAEDLYIPRPAEWEKEENPHIQDHNIDFLLRSHAVVIDTIAGKVQQNYAALSLFDGRHSIGNDGHYKGKVLILRDTALKESYRTPENQLFLAETGFGCSPTALGRAVYGQFLIDGESSRFDRSDFVGVIDENYLPDWAKEKREKLCPSDAPDESAGQGMKGV